MPATRYGGRKVGVYNMMSSEFVHREVERKETATIEREVEESKVALLEGCTERHDRNTRRRMTTEGRCSL